MPRKTPPGRVGGGPCLPRIFWRKEKEAPPPRSQADEEYIKRLKQRIIDLHEECKFHEENFIALFEQPKEQPVAIASKIVPNTASKPQYPCLKRIEGSPLILLMTGPTTGTVVHKEWEDPRSPGVGYFSTKWVGVFVTCNDIIQLNTD